MADYYGNRRFRSGDVAGFDASYYLEQNPDVGTNYRSWRDDKSAMHWGDYVRANPGLESAWRGGIGIGDFIGGNPEPGIEGVENKPSRWDWGKAHWDKYGAGQQHKRERILPMVVGEFTGDGNTRTIWTGPTISDAQEEAAFGAWHFDEYGRDEGRYKSETDWYNSPEQIDIRTKAFQKELLDAQAAGLAKQTAIQEEMAAKAARVKGSSPTGVGGAASIKGSRLSITEAGGRKGTKRFARPTEFMNTLGIGSATASTGKSTLTL